MPVPSGELIPSIGQAAAAAAPIVAAGLPALALPVIAVGGAVIATCKILDIIVNGGDSSA